MEARCWGGCGSVAGETDRDRDRPGSRTIIVDRSKIAGYRLRDHQNVTPFAAGIQR